MRIISHRGNLHGPNREKENTENYLLEALNSGFDLEFDVWYLSSKFWLGHDEPQIPFSFDSIIQWSSRYTNQHLYVHCKNTSALENILNHEKKNIIPFFHDVDRCILLRDNTIWVHPNAVTAIENRNRSIAVVSTCRNVEYDVSCNTDYLNFYGICTDYPVDVRNSL